MDGYFIMNLDDFDKMNVPQIYETKEFQDLGSIPYCVFKGENYGIIWNGEIMTPYTNGVNPFASKKNAAYIDDERNLWVGVRDDS